MKVNLMHGAGEVWGNPASSMRLNITMPVNRPGSADDGATIPIAVLLSWLRLILRSARSFSRWRYRPDIGLRTVNDSGQ